MKVWITAFVLTDGITEVESQEAGDLMTIKVRNHEWLVHISKKSTWWHRTQEDAIARAEYVRQAKIESLQRQIAKLKAKHFQQTQPNPH